MPRLLSSKHISVISPESRKKIRELKIENAQLHTELAFTKEQLDYALAQINNHNFYFSLYRQAESREKTSAKQH